MYHLIKEMIQMNIFKRKIYNKLLEWKNCSNGTRGLLLEGARRVGKSTIVKEFAENEYRSYIFIDFDEEGEEIRKIFDAGFRDLDSLFRSLSLYYHTELFPRQSLIVFDEVQRFPRAHEGRKYLVKDGRYDFIETGSLITLKLLSKGFTNPSEVDYLSRYPMDFEEFLMARGDTVSYPRIKDAFESRKPLGEVVNRKLMSLFRTYRCVGGRPQAVEQYLSDKVNFSLVDKVKRNIVNLYGDDLKKYDLEYHSFTSPIYSHIPAFLSSRNKMLKFSSIKKGGRYSNRLSSLDGIEKSRRGNLCQNTSDPTVGLGLTSIPSDIKIYSSDTGLLITQILKDNESTSNDLYRKLIFNKLSINRGMFFENSVSQALKGSGHSLYFHTFENQKAKYEIDFLVQRKGKLSPIEVKPSSYNSHVSLDCFLEKNKDRKNIGEPIIIYTKDLKAEDGILYIPIYRTGLI